MFLCTKSALEAPFETAQKEARAGAYIRPIVVGRKNWLFCDTRAGADASVMIFTILETAKANGLNPETYLNHLLTVLPDRFAQNPKAPIDDLLPWAADIHGHFAL